ncbi:MAG: ABC transporter ATP-binding protein [Pseudomonadota bacterium]|nr:ABC transporter ATP-binding protein [Pseudomonadota bacterium]
MTDTRAPAHPVDSEVDANYRIDVSKVDTAVLYRITKMAFRHKARMAIGICATVIAATFQLFIPQYLGQAVDQARGILAEVSAEGEAQGIAEDALLFTALLLLGAAVGRGLFTMMQNYQGEAVGQLIGYRLRLDYYRKLQQLSFSWHDRVHSGDLMTRGILDIEGLRHWVDTGFLRMILLTCLVGGGAVILIRNDLELGLMSLSFVPIVALRSSFARLKLRDAWMALQDQMSHLTKVMEENLGGIRVVRAFAAHAYEMARFDESSGKALEIAARRVRLFVHSTTQMSFVYFLAMAATLWVGGEKVLTGTITLGQLTETLTFMLILRMPVRQIGWMINSIARASTCGGRLFNVLDLQPSVADAPNAKPLQTTEGIVRFEGVDFRYPTWAKDERTLNGITFEARPGKMIGIVGPPGAGKTTIAQLLGRYYDVSGGRITIDGQDIREITLASLRDAVSIVHQEPFLFTASLNHNVAYGAPWAVRPDIEHSAQTAQLHNYIRGLPDSYNTLVGERGVSLSGGQRQRLSIARAILPDAKVLVFDDSTAAVDAATERQIREALAEFVAERAVIIVAHRLTSLMHADEILFVENGQIVERGSHEDLMTFDTRYRQLYELQSRASSEDAA